MSLDVKQMQPTILAKIRKDSVVRERRIQNSEFWFLIPPDP